MTWKPEAKDTDPWKIYIILRGIIISTSYFSPFFFWWGGVNYPIKAIGLSYNQEDPFVQRIYNCSKVQGKWRNGSNSVCS